MNRVLTLIIAATIVYVSSAEIVHGASFGDMFSGKKGKEQQRMLEQKEQECQAMLSQKERQYQKLVEEKKDSQDGVQDLRDKNSTLMEAYEKLKSDQTNILEQLKRLRRENQRCANVKESFDQMTKENEDFVAERDFLEAEIKTLSTNLDNLKLHIKGLNKENIQVSALLVEAQEDEGVKIRKVRESVKDKLENLKKRTAALNTENKKLLTQYEKSERETRRTMADYSELQKKLELHKSELDALENQHAELQEENRHLAQEASEFPKRFADLARHNRKLVKDTAHMHYNMGVSYIKGKEYKRAVKEFKRVLKLKPDDPYANYNLGYIYAEHLVDRPTAIAYFQNYLTYAKDARDANWVRKYILTWQTWYGSEKMK